MPVNLKGRSFLTLKDFTPDEIRYMLNLAADLKAKKRAGIRGNLLAGKNIVLLFEKTSTRTRCAFEVAAYDEGASVTFLDSKSSQMGKKETMVDTAKVLGRFYDGIEYRGYDQKVVEGLAANAGVPVWNGLTDVDHPTQALADILQQLDVQPGDDPHRILAAVQSYVSSSARYDLNTPAVPDGEDFVSWFLHESETGYCVHFATAAAILLRCMDVPARYVTGFSTNVTAGSWTTVTTDDAHAWVEYYVDGLGWYVLDPTPAMQDSHILTLQPDNSSETDPAPTQEENQVQQVPETSTTETTPDAPEVSPETSDKPTGTNQESSKTFHFFRYLWPILAAAAALLIWRALLFSIRRAAIGRGSGNRRAVTLYHHICWLARRTKTEVPAEFLEVAEKARFSHHKLSREELQPLQDHADQLTRQLLADKRFWRQFLYRVIYALG